MILHQAPPGGVCRQRDLGRSRLTDGGLNYPQLLHLEENRHTGLYQSQQVQWRQR